MEGYCQDQLSVKQAWGVNPKFITPAEVGLEFMLSCHYVCSFVSSNNVNACTLKLEKKTITGLKDSVGVVLYMDLPSWWECRLYLEMRVLCRALCLHLCRDKRSNAVSKDGEIRML